MPCHCHCTLPLEKPAAWCTENWVKLFKPLNNSPVPLKTCVTVARVANRVLMALVLILISAPCYAMGLLGYLLNRCKGGNPPPPPPPAAVRVRVAVGVPYYLRPPSSERVLLRFLNHPHFGKAIVSSLKKPQIEDADPAIIVRSKLPYPEQRTGMAVALWLHTLKYLDNQDLIRFSETAKIYSVLAARAFIIAPRVTEKRIHQAFIRYLNDFNGIVRIGNACTNSHPCQHEIFIRYRNRSPSENVNLGLFYADAIYNIFLKLPPNLIEGDELQHLRQLSPRWAKPLKVNLIHIDLNSLTDNRPLVCLG